MASFEYQGHRLAYTEYGAGDAATVLLPGLLLLPDDAVPARPPARPARATG